MTKKQKKEESDNENTFDNDKEIDEDIEDELSDEFNEELDNDFDSQLITDDKDNFDIEYIEDNYTINHNISKKEYLIDTDRISPNRLTKYEMVRILGERVKQLIMGAKPMIKNYEELSYEEIAEYELINNIIPFKIRRPLPNGKYEIWTLDELNKDHLLNL
jgi:DNA-directed RNA polymerase subunit K/omega